MITSLETVASSSATADIAYVVCIVSFFIAGGVAIYLLWDKINQHNAAIAKKPKTTKSRTAAKKATATKKVVKKPVKKVSKKK